MTAPFQSASGKPWLVALTHHARQRLAERCEVEGDAAVALAVEAYLKGVGREVMTGKLGRWVDEGRVRHGKADEVRAYGRWLFLFESRALITVLYLEPGHVSQVARLVREKAAAYRSAAR
jgi:hypothetical protein